MNENSTIEFEEIPEERQADSVRRSFRVSVKESIIKATINGKIFPVTDISPEGICILCEKKQVFTTDQTIENCELSIPGNTIENLTAKIMHLTAEGPENWHVGILWQDLSDDDLKIIALLVSDLKRKLLSENGEGQTS